MAPAFAPLPRHLIFSLRLLLFAAIASFRCRCRAASLEPRSTRVCYERAAPASAYARVCCCHLQVVLLLMPITLRAAAAAVTRLLIRCRMLGFTLAVDAAAMPPLPLRYFAPCRYALRALSRCFRHAATPRLLLLPRFSCRAYGFDI